MLGRLSGGGCCAGLPVTVAGSFPGVRSAAVGGVPLPTGGVDSLAGRALSGMAWFLERGVETAAARRRASGYLRTVGEARATPKQPRNSTGRKKRKATRRGKRVARGIRDRLRGRMLVGGSLVGPSAGLTGRRGSEGRGHLRRHPSRATVGGTVGTVGGNGSQRTDATDQRFRIVGQVGSYQKQGACRKQQIVLFQP